MENVQTCDGCGAALTGERVPGMAEVSLLQCTCGLVITSPRPSVEEIGGYYPPTYYSYRPAAPSVTRRIVDKLKEYKGGYPVRDGLLSQAFWRTGASLLQNLFVFHIRYQGADQKLLEIGCGSGLNLRWAKDHGWDVYGLELGENTVSEAHRQGFANVQCGNIEDAEFVPGFFDAVLMNHVLEHLYSPGAALGRSRELLRPGGTLLVTVPKFDSWPRHVSGELWVNLDYPRHLYHFTQPVLTKMIQNAGFDVREVRFSSRAISVYFTLCALKKSGQLKRILKRPQGAFSDVMLIVAERV